MQNTFDLNPGTESDVARLKRERAEKIAAGQQLHARIKPSSKYYGQGEPDALFPVYVDATAGGDYPVQGGPGSQYRLADVFLYVVSDGHELKIN